MSLLTIIGELWRLLKDNIVRILLGSILVSFLVVGGRYMLGQYLYGDVQSSSQYLQEVFQQEPASFKVIVTIEDGQILSNSYVYDDYFTSPEIVDFIESQTGIEYSQTLQAEKDLDLYKTPSYRGSIAGVRDNASGVFTFRFLVGETAEENLTIAQAYQDLMESDQVAFAENHSIDITEDASIGEKFDIEVYDMVATPEIINKYIVDSSRPLIIYGVLGFILGFMISYALVFLLQLGKSRIQYAFEYGWDIEDYHLMLKQDHNSLANLVQELSNQGASVYAEILDNTRVEVNPIDFLTDYQTNDSQPNYIIVKANQTDKDWYRQTYQMAKLNHQPVTIIHII